MGHVPARGGYMTHEVPPISALSMQTNHTSSEAAQLHNGAAPAHSHAALLHSYTAPATCSTLFSMNTYNMLYSSDTVTSQGEVTHGSEPHLHPEQHCTTQVGGSNVNEELACSHSRPACSISNSYVCGPSALPTGEQEDHGVTTASTDCTFSAVGHLAVYTGNEGKWGNIARHAVHSMYIRERTGLGAAWVSDRGEVISALVHIPTWAYLARFLCSH